MTAGEKQKDHVKVTTSLRGAKRRGNPFSFRSLPGTGRCFASQGIRIATSAFGLLAMTEWVHGADSPGCGGCLRWQRGTARGRSLQRYLVGTPLPGVRGCIVDRRSWSDFPCTELPPWAVGKPGTAFPTVLTYHITTPRTMKRHAMHQLQFVSGDSPQKMPSRFPGRALVIGAVGTGAD